MTAAQKKALIDAAKAARIRAYAPYSKFEVGAAVLTDGGEIFDGCNIENASYGATVCAERVAIFKAVSNGKAKIRALAVIGRYPTPLPPCGICRQVLSEFGSKETEIIMMNDDGLAASATAGDLLPLSFEYPGTPNE